MAKDPYKYFRVEARELADQLGQGLLELERGGGGGEIVPRLLRLAHTLKGAARVVRQPEIAEHAHAIEGALSPFRELADKIPREHVDSILKLIDGIANRVAALNAPEEPSEAQPARAPGEAPARTAAPAPEAAAYRSVRTDVEEIDELLDGVTEVYTQMGGLRDAEAITERAHRVAELLAEQLAAAARDSDRIAAARIGRAAASTEQLRGLVAELERSIAGTHERIDRELRQVREAAEQLRLVPADALFPHFERTARDAAQALGKDVVFIGKGGDNRLDAHVVRVVQDAIIQLIRNAVAHGIETREERARARKPRQGTVEVTVYRRGRQVVFRCQDDGRGIDVDALRGAAIRKGHAPAEIEKLDANGLIRILLKGGITTSPTVNSIAGRGIGMDIVREAIAKLSGDLVVHTERGKGTTFELVMPISVSSVEALLVESGGVTTTIPLFAVRHTLRIEPGDVHRTAHGEAILHDGRATPLVSLGRLLGRSGHVRRGSGMTAVVVAGASGHAAIAVDRLRGTSNIVFRALPELAPTTAAVAGASLDADGSPVLMLDPEGLVEMSLRTSDLAAAPDPVKRPVLVVDDSLTTRMLEQSILESAGYVVDVATSGEEGLERARRAEYALILVDVEMPGMDGFTFIEEVRRDPRLHHIPAILVTSRNAPEDQQRGRDVGAQGYVVKSEFDQADLLEHIRQLVA